MFNRKMLLFFSMFVILAASCGGRGTPTGIPNPIADEMPPAGPADVSGIWTGNLIDLAVGVTCTMELNLTQTSDASVTGTVHLLCPATNELYNVSGTYDGTNLHIQEPNGRFFTAALSGETMTGYVGQGVYDDPTNAWGEYTLTRGSADGESGSVPPGTDLSGTWTGSMNDNVAGVTCTMDLILNQGPDEYVAGNVHFTCPATNELYDLTGSFDGTTLHLLDVNNRYLTATLSGETLSGYVSWGVFDDPTNFWGQYTLTRSSTP